MEQASRSEPAESSSYSPFKYDVLVSSTGTGACKNFVDRLCCVLKQVGVRNSRDINDFEKEVEIDKLMKAIEESEIFIPIFSANYAESERCLKEIQKIMEVGRIKDREHLILPIFYQVEPRDVRRQWGPFRSAFDEHEKNKNLERTTVNDWREALEKAASFSGYDIDKTGHEKKIEEIVKMVLKELNKSRPLNVAEPLVGIDSRVGEVLKLLEVGADDVRMVVIHGMGGIGKTTLAKAVYNKIYKEFEVFSFISNIREQVAKSPSGLVMIQNQLMSQIYKSYHGEVHDTSRATGMLERILGSYKVLVVLDDVDDGRQLQELIGEHNFCKQGSRIIVTTRDEQVIASLKWESKPDTYSVKALDHEKSLQLFCWHAFRKHHLDLDDPRKEFSNKVMDAMDGLPLAIEVLGSTLYGIGEDIDTDEILRFPGIHLHDVFQRLKISYDDLNEHEKAIFLDIACFFDGIDKETAIFVWNACGFSAVTSINGLCRMSLVKITEADKLEMHAVLRELGRTTVNESESDPGKRSRLWVQKEIMGVLKQRKGTRRVEGISLIMEKHKKDERESNSKYAGDVAAITYNNADHNDGDGESENDNDINVRTVDTDGFASMDRLRLLTINHVDLKGCYKNMPKELRWLQWHGCPLKSIKGDLSIKEVAALDLSYSNITDFRNQKGQVFQNLKLLNLTACNGLVTTDFSAFPKLVKLILDYCTELVEIKIENLKNLVLLSMANCIRLKDLPNFIPELTSLERLNVSGCISLEKLPDCIYQLKSLKTLDISGCVKLPRST